MQPKAVVEIAVEVTEIELKHLLNCYLKRFGIPYYIEPPRFKTLDEVEAECEGK